MPSNEIKNVLYIGDYDENYSRNYIFINGLRNQGINVYQINLTNFNKKQRIKVLLKSFKKFKKRRIDIVIFYSIRTSIINFILSRIFAYIKRIPFVHDIFISKLLTYFYDRKLANVKKRFKPKIYYWFYYYLLDFLECHLSNYILLDTASHIKYFHEKYKVPLKKFRKIYVGARDDIFHPIKKKAKDKFIIGYWGTFIPLHGVKYMIQAFKLIENEKNILFQLIGTGQTLKSNKELAEKLNLKNINFIEKIFLKGNLNELSEMISNFDIGLGLFGKDLKTLLVIPNKLFEGMAMKIPMITCESSAIKELLTHNEDILLCEPANPKVLANSIIKLKNDELLRNKIKENAHILFNSCCTIEKLSKKLNLVLNKLI